MLRWKRKLQGINSAEPDEFAMFIDPGEAPETEPAGGGEKEIEEESVESEEEESKEAEEDSKEPEETEEEESEESESSELSSDQTTIQTLQEQNKKLMALMENLTKKEDPQEEPETPTSTDPFDSDMLDNMAETLNWDKDEKGAFKTFFKQYTESIVSNTLKKAQEMTPKVVDESLSRQQKVASVQKDFYSRHPALENVKAYVGQVASQLAKENKNATLNQVLDEAAKRSYKAFGLKENNSGKQGSKAEKSKSPAFPKSKGARKKTPKKTALQSDLDAMLAIDE